MTRTVEEWIGKSDNSPAPVRVKLRVFDRFTGRCAECRRPINSKLPAAYDHIVAIINGGANRETNLQLLCTPCHRLKTNDDVAEKKVTARVKAKHLGISKRKGRPMPGSRASGIKMKIGGGWVKR